MDETIRIALPQAPLVPAVVLYVVTKTGRYLNESQADWLVVSGQVKIDGEVSRKLHVVVSEGYHALTVYGRVHPVLVVHTGKE